MRLAKSALGCMSLIYYMHTMKCGGSSARKAIKDLNVTFTEISELNPNAETIIFLSLRKNKKIIVFGHIQDLPLPRPNAGESWEFYKQILFALYRDPDNQFIMPTRDPVNLVQSWLHYTETRVLGIINSSHDDVYNPISGRRKNDLAMLQRMSSVKQNCVVLSLGKIVIKGDSLKLRDQDEEENIILFAKHIIEKEKNLSPLLAMQWQLHRLEFLEVSRLVYGQTKYQLPLIPQQVIYYDLFSPCPKVPEMINQIIHPLFSSNLLNTRINSSRNPPKRLASDMPSVVEDLKSFFHGEYQIHKRAF